MKKYNFSESRKFIYRYIVKDAMCGECGIRVIGGFVPCEVDGCPWPEHKEFGGHWELERHVCKDGIMN